jgi:2'-5' RNA ligase
LKKIKEEELRTKIGYVDVLFSSESNRLLNNIIKDLGLQKDFNDDFHCTIAYSTKEFDFKLPNESQAKITKNNKEKNIVHVPIKETCTIKDFGNFKTPEGLNLHVVLECDFCKSEFNRTKKAGAVYDYPEYTAHVTLMYNCSLPGETKGIPKKYFKNNLKKYIGKKLTLVKERKQKLNTNWVQDSKDSKDS